MGIVSDLEALDQERPETQETETYVASTKTLQQVLDDNAEFMVNEKLAERVTPEMKEDEKPPAHLQFQESVPTFGVAVKLHKKNKLRFIAKSHGTSLTQMSDLQSAGR